MRRIRMQEVAGVHDSNRFTVRAKFIRKDKYVRIVSVYVLRSLLWLQDAELPGECGLLLRGENLIAYSENWVFKKCRL